MPYHVEFHEEIKALISYISSEVPTDEELRNYLEEVVRLERIAIQNQWPRLYHILIIESQHYNLTHGLQTIRTVQQHKGLRANRKQLNMITILVGQTSKALQIMITTITQNAAGERQVAVFPTLDTALAFVHKINANSQKKRSLE